MNPDTEAALLARYKALCELVDHYRDGGFNDLAKAVIEGEMRMVLELLRELNVQTDPGKVGKL